MAANGRGEVGAEDDNTSTSSEDDPTENISQEQKQIIELSKRLPKLLNIFNLHEIIGEGSYSSVYLASLKCDSHIPDENKKFFAIKHLIPISHPDRIEHELRCLKYIGGCDNVVGVDLCLRQCDAVVFIMPYIPHTKFSEYFKKMDTIEIKHYMKNLLLALRRVHQFNIIHRDVKPSNFLYDRNNKRYLLVDFGLAQTVYYEPPPKKIKMENMNLPDLLNNNSNGARVAAKRKYDEIVNEKDVKDVEPQIKRALISGDKNNFQIYPTTPVQKICPKYTSSKLLNHNNAIRESKKLESVRRQVFLSDNKNDIDVKKEKPIKFVAANQSPLSRCNIPNGNYKQKGDMCRCFGLPASCSICLNRQPYKASRSGTQGYRPPEVLLKYSDQTTAVDIWASGIILLSFLSGCYPFFRGSDDLAALAEHVTIFGSLRIKKVAHMLGRHFMSSYNRRPVDLKKLCKYLKSRHVIPNNIDKNDADVKLTDQTKILPLNNVTNNPIKDGCENDNHVANSDVKFSINHNDLKHGSNFNSNIKSDKSELTVKKISQKDHFCDDCALSVNSCICQSNEGDSFLINDKISIDDKNSSEFPDEAYDLLVKLLDVNPRTRITANEALNHPFLLDL